MHVLLFGLVMSFLPTIIAYARHTHNAFGIFLINLFLGWTVIGWFVALFMAMFSWSYRPQMYYPPQR